MFEASLLLCRDSLLSGVVKNRGIAQNLPGLDLDKGQDLAAGRSGDNIQLAQAMGAVIARDNRPIVTDQVVFGHGFPKPT